METQKGHFSPLIHSDSHLVASAEALAVEDTEHFQLPT